MNKETESLLAIAYELIAISETIRQPRESGTIYGPVLKGGSGGGGPLKKGRVSPNIPSNDFLGSIQETKQI